jgi:hypothetical protein
VRDTQTDKLERNLIIWWNEECRLLMGESGGDKTAAQRKEAADSVLTSHGYNKSDITFARADKGSLKMSLAIQAGKVSKDADEEGAWNRRIAHVETHTTLLRRPSTGGSFCAASRRSSWCRSR